MKLSPATAKHLSRYAHYFFRSYGKPGFIYYCTYEHYVNPPRYASYQRYLTAALFRELTHSDTD